MRSVTHSEKLFAVRLCFGFSCCAQGSEIPPLRTNEPIYQNPFDLAGGGASLTRATQDGVAFSNPSLAAFGFGFLRSVYFRNAVHTNAESAKIARGVQQGTVKIDPAFLKGALKAPYHLGVDVSTGFITSKFNFGVISSARADFQGRQFGSVGMPELRSRSYAVAGVALAGSWDFGDLLGVGAALKPLYVAEAYEDIGLEKLSAGENASSTLQDSLKKGYGLSSDVAVTFQKRTSVVDVRWATVLSDLGQTTFKGGVRPWKQTLNTGLGFTLHTDDSAVHCAVDYRDALGAYQEHYTKRVYLGCKAISARYLGVAAGLYQGSVTFGGLINLFLFRLEAGTYTREMGKQVGTNTRRLFFIALGSEI